MTYWSYDEYALAHTIVEQINQRQNLTHQQWEKMTLDSTTASASIDLTYDAWNRLVKTVRDSKTLGEYEYDGLNRRTIKKEYDDAGVLSATRHYYYSTAWQVLEERIDSDTTPDRQYVWGQRYVDDLILRDRDTTASGTLDERLYSLSDANWNVIALADTSGVVQERYAYDAYGNVSILTDAYANRDFSSFDWSYLFTTRELDIESGIYNYRNRYYDSLTGRFINRDPIEEERHLFYSLQLFQEPNDTQFDLLAGQFNLYEYVSGKPLTYNDPSGLHNIKGSLQHQCKKCGGKWVPKPGAECGENGCSSPLGDNPLGILSDGCSFFESCQKHDRCYCKCSASKSKCDKKFLKDMLQQCWECYEPFVDGSYENYAQCKTWAKIYYLAVKYFGATPYVKTQNKMCRCCDCKK